MSEPSSSSPLPPRMRKCSRCDQASTLLLRKNVPSCTPCAQRAVEQRAKGLLEHARGAALLDRQGGIDALRKGKASATAPDDERGGIALAFSGGGSSRALLNVATRSLAPPPWVTASIGPSQLSQPRKARPVEVTRIDVIYIDDSILVPGAGDQTEEVRQIVEEQGGMKAGLRFVPLKLEDIFEEGSQGSVIIQCLVGSADERHLDRTSSSTGSPRDALLSLFHRIEPPSTSRSSASSSRTRSEDLHALLIQVLLAQTARSLGDSALLMGDNASRGAINLIDGIAKGRGHKWPVEGASAIWRDELLVLRPLRECFAKELAFYNRTLRLRYLTPQDRVASAVLSHGSHMEGSGLGEKASIGRLTENFIFHLEKGVPSTVNTVGRTGGKLVMADAADDIMPIERTLASLELQDSTKGVNARAVLTVGTGQKGNRLVQGVRSLPRWNGHNACPLCDLPAQTGASEWKSNLSILGPLSLDGQGDIKRQTGRQQPVWKEEDKSLDTIRLDKLLCYACLIILDVPEEVRVKYQLDKDAGGVTLPLPSYVLKAARARLDRASHPSSSRVNNIGPFDSNEATPIESSTTSPVQEHPLPQVNREVTTAIDVNTSAGHVKRQVGVEEMKGKVGEFLLEDDE